MASPAGGKSRIDSLSHEDLRVFAKKQMAMLKNLKSKTEQLTSERDAVSRDLSKTREEQECLTMKTQTLEETLRQVQREKDEERSKNEDEKGKNSELEFQYEELKVKYEDHDDETQRFRTLAAEKVDALESAKMSLEQQITDIVAERNERVGQLTERVSELEKEVFSESREDSLGELENECEQLHSIIDDLKKENENLVDQIAESKQTSLNPEHDKTEKCIVNEDEHDFKTEVADLRGQIQQMQNILDDLNTTNVDLTKRMGDHNQQSEELKDYKVENEKLVNSNYGKDEELSDLKKQLQTYLENTQTETKALKNELENSIAARERDHVAKQEALVKLETLKDTAKERDEYNIQLEQETVKNVSLLNEIDALKNILSQLKEQSVAAEIIIKDNESEAKKITETLNEQITTMKSDLIVASSDNAALNKKIEGMRLEMKNNNSDMENKEINLAKLASHLEALKKEHEACHLKLNEAELEYQSFHKTKELEHIQEIEDLENGFSEKLVNAQQQNNQLVSDLKNKSYLTQVPTDPDYSEKEKCSKVADLEKMLVESGAELAFIKEKLVRFEELEIIEKKYYDHEVQNKKLKQLVLKTKKEMDQVKKKFEREVEEKNRVSDLLKQASSKASTATSSFQAEYDCLQDTLDQTTEEKNNLQSENEILKDNVRDLKNEKEEKLMVKKEVERLTEKLAGLQQRLDTSMAQEVQLEAEMAREKRTRLEEKNIATDKLAKLEKQLEHEKTKLTQSSIELEDTREAMKTQQLLNMEIVDYERTVKELKAQVELKTDEANSYLQDGKQVQDLLDQVRHRAATAEEALEAAEERSEKYRSMIDDANTELSHYKEKEYKTQSQIELNSATEEQLRFQVEEMKIQISTLEAKRLELLNEKKSFENKREREKIQIDREVSELKKESEVTREEKGKIEKEFTTYKARVHTVLKQQKEQKTDPNQLEQAKEALLLAHDQIKKLHVTHEELKTKLLQAMEQNNKLKIESENKVENQKFFEESSKNKEKALLDKIKAMEDESKQTKLQIQQLHSDSQQIRFENKRKLEEVESRARSDLGLKLAMFERRATQLEAENHQLKLKLSQKEMELEKNTQKDNHWKGVSPLAAIDVSKMERSEPVGAEQDEDTASIMSLEQILQSPTKTLSTKSDTPNIINTELVQKLQILERKIEHQSSILRESEATNARLSEQSGLLKTEIRRLEKNQERKDNIHNLEYLKNIIFKFITLQPGTERSGLVPVLETMLQFDQSEKERIITLALGEDAYENSKSSNWGTYLPRWGGL